MIAHLWRGNRHNRQAQTVNHGYTPGDRCVSRCVLDAALEGRQRVNAIDLKKIDAVRGGSINYSGTVVVPAGSERCDYGKAACDSF